MSESTKGTVPKSISLYVHIPFCETKCPYCDFNTYAKIEALIPQYVEALEKEVRFWGGVLAHAPISTVFFGGGTPSYLPEERIGSILSTVRESFAVDGAAEVSLEANPGDLTPSKLAAYLRSGVNRLSIGVQSFDDHLLKVLGRRHSAGDAVQAYLMAVEAGFDNVSIDLMYGLPRQSIEEWRRTLDQAIALGPPHVSMYCLSLEPGTPMERWVRTGAMAQPDSDLAADMYLMAQDSMGTQGYRQYEISNWAQSSYEAQHNLTYWRNQPYLGVGPGAHSYLSKYRFANLNSPHGYIRQLENEHLQHKDNGVLTKAALRTAPAVETVEPIDRRLEMAETLMLGLRLDEGVGVAEFRRRFGETPAQAYDQTLVELHSDGLVEPSDGRLRLTPRGRIMSNEVFTRFFR